VQLVVRGQRLWVTGLLLALAAGACGGASSASGTDRRLRIVTTVSPITSIVANIVGDVARIDGVVPEGTNSHTFEPAPSAANVLSAADLVIVNGLKLEDPTLRLARANKKASAKVIEVGTAVLPESDWIYDFSFPKEGGKPNPHLWTDPLYARKYAEVIAREVSVADPANASRYAANLAAFVAKIDALDAALRAATATLPAEHRKLLTYHDAYAYFAKDYGWTVIGAMQVGSFEDPSPKEVAALIQQVRAERVPAIFGSEVFPSPVLERIGSEANVRYVDKLRDDDLPGKPGDDGHSWLGLMRFDYSTMVDALGGDSSTLRALDVKDVVKDTARYPQ
jgi:ABC-type Zn uptake system ZnuABC Zn-binding protein ZnuA